MEHYQAVAPVETALEALLKRKFEALEQSTC